LVDGTDFEGGRQPPDRTRFHTELHEVFEKRKQLLTEWFLIEEPDDEVMKSLRAHFPYNRPSAALIKSVFLNFSKLKTDSRNVFGPSYNAVLKERKQGYQSGDYDDSEQLLDLLEKHICARVDSNFQKSVSDGVVDYKKKLQEQGQTATAKMISDEKKTLIQNKTAYYNQKKAGWHNSVVHTCPGSFLCFLLLGAPGKNLHSLDIGRVVELGNGAAGAAVTAAAVTAAAVTAAAVTAAADRREELNDELAGRLNYADAPYDTEDSVLPPNGGQLYCASLLCENVYTDICEGEESGGCECDQTFCAGCYEQHVATYKRQRVV
jgi:hypothetical protein